MAERSTVSTAAHQAFLAEEPGPLAKTDWSDAVFLHFTVDPGVLQPRVPFELDLWEGQAYISLVLFTQENFRLARGGPAGVWLTWPVATYRFCNVRTYVRHAGIPAIYFLVEWITNLPAVLLARSLYGLPCRLCQSSYDHDRMNRLFVGAVRVGNQRLACQAEIDYSAAVAPAEAGTLDEFCLERYAAFTTSMGRRQRFRIWHEAWPHQTIDAEVIEPGLLAQSGDWYTHARLTQASYSPGVSGVWLGRPHVLERGSTDSS